MGGRGGQIWGGRGRTDRKEGSDSDGGEVGTYWGKGGGLVGW